MRTHTPCSNNENITSSSILEFSSILDTKGAIRSWANFFTVKKKRNKYVYSKRTVERLPDSKEIPLAQDSNRILGRAGRYIEYKQ